MDLKDLISLKKKEIDEIITLYYNQTIDYRIDNNFEVFLHNIEKCQICQLWNLETILEDTNQTLGIGKLCPQCLEDSK